MVLHLWDPSGIKTLAKSTGLLRGTPAKMCQKVLYSVFSFNVSNSLGWSQLAVGHGLEILECTIFLSTDRLRLRCTACGRNLDQWSAPRSLCGCEEATKAIPEAFASSQAQGCPAATHAARPPGSGSPGQLGPPSTLDPACGLSSRVPPKVMSAISRPQLGTPWSWTIFCTIGAPHCLWFHRPVQ